MERMMGKKAEKFVAWLTMAKGFLPKSMTLNEAQSIFIRKLKDDNGEVKDDQAFINTDRKSGTKGLG